MRQQEEAGTLLRTYHLSNLQAGHQSGTELLEQLHQAYGAQGYLTGSATTVLAGGETACNLVAFYQNRLDQVRIETVYQAFTGDRLQAIVPSYAIQFENNRPKLQIQLNGEAVPVTGVGVFAGRFWPQERLALPSVVIPFAFFDVFGQAESITLLLPASLSSEQESEFLAAVRRQMPQVEVVAPERKNAEAREYYRNQLITAGLMLFSCINILGLAQYLCARRRREFAVQRLCGARRRDIAAQLLLFLLAVDVCAFGVGSLLFFPLLPVLERLGLPLVVSAGGVCAIFLLLLLCTLLPALFLARSLLRPALYQMGGERG